MQRYLYVLMALSLLALIGEPVRAADTEPAPRRWLDTKNYLPGPRVYGWSYQPDKNVYATRSCGMYRYWDGKQCVDARDVPPPM
ncbi:hypothetical protein [Hyphomicrobium sp.]|uniref:hypothetical protein n=1 Tax=Hyphomicrobium sp. TaxID=82 RepID=UPI002E327BC0|nr:hypothetical protein [Hyphomicrobium sp.]HEX2840518.1 hypothetical protein [Hyphomicrobium sp.]